ncbi:putative GEM-like protein 8 [Arachis duranensis]|uniref:GEM-like protein 8 n=1 Tax=Arachis duranensis TaxID=130453 RepID=A0A6P4CA99_ARADU|nr:putative GEM-like protein 8 [Arachis duranensis]
MKKGNLLLQELVTSIPIISRAFGNPSKRYLAESCSGKYHNKSSAKAKKNSKLNSVLTKMNKFGRKADNFANGVREHVMRLGGMKISNTMKVKKNFIQLFGMKEREKLLKASQCCLSTTSGPISGILFISTHKVAFCSDRSIKIISSPQQDFNTRIHYKVAIPVEKINCVNQSQNVEKPSEKYIEIVTEDNFDFWFMGFLNYQKTFKYLQQAMFSHA